jgi:hypothetical protein
MSYKIARKILYPRKISNIYAAADLADVYVAVFGVTATLADENDVFAIAVGSP